MTSKCGKLVVPDPPCLSLVIVVAWNMYHVLYKIECQLNMFHEKQNMSWVSFVRNKTFLEISCMLLLCNDGNVFSSYLK